MELVDRGCVVRMGVSQREVQFAVFLDFAAEGEDRFGGWGVGGKGERDALLCCVLRSVSMACYLLLWPTT